jgi:hypothetical protein
MSSCVHGLSHENEVQTSSVLLVEIPLSPHKLPLSAHVRKSYNNGAQQRYVLINHSCYHII